MLNFPRWKILSIVFACLLTFVLAAPNVLTSSMIKSLPSWMPSKTVSLGLDLRGGSHLLLQVDVEAYMREHLSNTLDTLRSELRKQKVTYQGLKISNQAILVTVMPSTLEGASKVDVADLVRKVDPGLEIKETTEGSYEIRVSEQALKETGVQLIDQSINIVERRVNETGTREPIIQRQGLDRILLQVPGLEDPEQLKNMLGKTAKMTFHLVNEDAWADASGGSAPPGTRILSGDDNDLMPNGQVQKYPIFSRVLLSGDMLTGAAASFEEGKPAVSFQFNTAGAERFGDITRDNVGKRFAIVLDNKVITAPVIRTPILGGSGVISGNFTTESANELAILLRAGALPAPLKILEERSVGPSLGADSIEAGKRASFLAVLLVMGFMVLCYGLFGLFANIALIINMVMILAALSLFQATLTLPGIAGMVLTLGMAVDANVLIYERIREEIRNGRTPYAAIDQGFKTAFATIVDSNVTTLIAAFLLYYFGSGSVKGFAVTLTIGILCSMFTAILVTRLMIVVWLKKVRPKTIPI